MAISLHSTTNLAAGDTIANSQRGKEILITAFHKQVTHEAQARGSNMLPATTHVTLSGAVDLFNIQAPVEYGLAAGGVHKTVYSKFEDSRRAMFVRHYEYAGIQDSRDSRMTAYDQLQSLQPRLAKAQGRVMDQVCLDAIIASAVLTNDSDVVTAGSQANTGVDPLATTASGYDAWAASSQLAQNTFQSVIKYKYKARDNMYFNIKKTAAGVADDAAEAGVGNFNTDTFVDLNHIIDLRAARDRGKYCISLTPELNRRLKKDVDFKSSEQVFDVGGSVRSMSARMVYHDFVFIPIENQVLPTLNPRNLIVNYSAAAGSPVVPAHYSFFARALNIDNPIVEPYVGRDLQAVTSVDPTDVIDGAYKMKTESLTSTARHLVYIWSPECLYWSSSGITKMRQTENQDLSFAEMLFSSIPCSAMLIQEDYAMTYLLPHPECEIKVKGTKSRADATRGNG